MYSVLNPFPDVLFLAFFASFILRLAVGIFFVTYGYLRLVKKHGAFKMAFIDQWRESGVMLLKGLGISELLAGSMLIIGLYTQIAALLGMFIAIFAISTTNTKSVFGNEKNFYILIFVVSLSLFITGAGPFAFDLPL